MWNENNVSPVILFLRRALDPALDVCFMIQVNPAAINCLDVEIMCLTLFLAWRQYFKANWKQGYQWKVHSAEAAEFGPETINIVPRGRGHLCWCWGNNCTYRAVSRSSDLLVKGSVLCREARPGVVTLSLAGDLAAAWHLADPAAQLRDYRPPRVSVMWSRLSPTHSWWPQTFPGQLWQTSVNRLLFEIFLHHQIFTRGVFHTGSWGISWKFTAGNLWGAEHFYWFHKCVAAAQLEQKHTQISKRGLCMEVQGCQY